jgi:hypothetical protein
MLLLIGTDVLAKNEGEESLKAAITQSLHYK